MNKNKKTVIIVIIAAALIAVIAGAYFGYRALSSKYPSESPSPSAKSNAVPSDPEEEEEVHSSSLPESDGTAEAENPAPDFAVYDADGNIVKLSDFKGTPVIVNFWATWCGPCQDEMPLMQEAYSEHSGEIAFMFVNLTDGVYDTEERVFEFIDRYGYDFPVYFDSDASGAEAYGVTGIPFTVFIDKNGGVAATHIGSISEDALKEGIDSIN